MLCHQPATSCQFHSALLLPARGAVTCHLSTATCHLLQSPPTSILLYVSFTCLIVCKCNLYGRVWRESCMWNQWICMSLWSKFSTESTCRISLWPIILVVARVQFRNPIKFCILVCLSNREFGRNTSRSKVETKSLRVSIFKECYKTG